ncbi:hypothetical protein [Mycobacterium gastri]|uniref:Uncharacterized protein n=1 Tax=Mycobacterium gastri TaxID=1777 RepID=A0A1X1VW28_MYCGS|nr:hypothetical protein [Mycobacterium gastri]ETW22551.1 hypothetical protein MGAST_19450 [Mycobacterium gastri 'Wayne']ORV73208.1 hypothetical protein AWC07_02880 [Mycobacterium gastri]
MGAVIAGATGGPIALPFGLSAGMLPAIGSAAGLGAFPALGPLPHRPRRYPNSARWPDRHRAPPVRRFQR